MPTQTLVCTPGPTLTPSRTPTRTPTLTPTPSPTPAHPLAIESLRAVPYAGSDLVVEQALGPGSNYDRFIASYDSDGLKIYGLLTVPHGERPESGWPAVIFNHGYIPPDQYRTTERYIAYTDAFSRNGYVLFRPDYRGHGNSEGDAGGAYTSADYTIDVLNALASVRRYPAVDPNRIGMWGHSMGGQITLQVMVVSRDVRAGVIWAGLMGSYEDLQRWWWWPRWGWSDGTPVAGGASQDRASAWLAEMETLYGAVDDDAPFWAALSPTSYLVDLSGPLQLHHGTGDTTVSTVFSEKLYRLVQEAGHPVELYLYDGDDHNISNSFGVAMVRSVEFFDLHVKAR
ncbi:MAG: alpha/beta fold hydrolase [Chloroflexi bacterium]|nr:alpha/beta fold hydrolase [Chloroflexota bacterium]